jgi:2-polyprenyl-3-methyl-5-hydroxy-6-metoxy-1,4-benzoquinol methylase
MTSYQYYDGAPSCANTYLWPELRRIIESRHWSDRRAFDLGCGNGSTSGMLSELGFRVTGVDSSESGIAQAQQLYPNVHTHIGSAYDNLVATYGTFPLVVSLEVLEHCFEPRTFARTFLSLIAPGGLGVLSTPYHGYLKNLALALSGQMDRHFTALWDGGHIKFFSMATLGLLLKECGAKDVGFVRVGRVSLLAKSMVAVVKN